MAATVFVICSKRVWEVKILYVTTIGGTMGFFKNFIKELLEHGNRVDIACNNEDSEVPEYYRDWGCSIYRLPCSRKPFDKGNIAAIKKLRELAGARGYDIVHCHTPVAAFCTRVACIGVRRQGTKVFYTAHGFHFYTGAPLKNWLAYYPVEWLCSWWTDVLVTINREDYKRAKKHFHAKKVAYVPGVGIDTGKFQNGFCDRQKKRQGLGLKDTDIMLLSVGELCERKNHEIVIRAIAELNNPNVKYFICGQGNLEAYLSRLASESGLSGQVELLGFRNDISELCQAADLFVFPSLQEGLPVALMEAAACKTPVVCSRIRGNIELVPEPHLLFDPHNAGELKGILDNLTQKCAGKIADSLLESVDNHYKCLQKFDLEEVGRKLGELYEVQGGYKRLEVFITRKRIETELMIPDNSVILFSVGELNENKNHKVIVEALGLIKKQRPDLYRRLYYLIAGEGRNREVIEDIALKKGVGSHVRLLGFVGQIEEIMRAVDIFLLPSRREGLNVSLMEAMASGLPCIVSDIRGNRDLIRNRRGGRRVASEDVWGWKKAITELSLNRNNMGRNNIKTVSGFLFEVVNKRVNELYADEEY